MSAGPIRLVGSVLVRNEDLFVERAIRNVASVCDRIHAFDHFSNDRTWEVLRELAREFDHLDVQRIRRASDSHRPLEQYTGTPTWALGVDGDELFDPSALARLRKQLLAGEHADVFRLKGHVLNCEELDVRDGTAAGYMAPPSRPITKLFNFGALESWSGSSQRLHDGDPVFRHGYGWESMRYLYDLGWDDDPLRCLHVCFLPRSSHDEAGFERRNLNESRVFDRSIIGVLKRTVRAPWVPPDVGELHRRGTNWKRSWYARGERVTVDATPFLGSGSY